MTDTPRHHALWTAIHDERSALADDLASLDDAAWATPSLCPAWTVEDVVAHLRAAASIGRLRWITSILAARFDADLHNRRRRLEHLGPTPAQTLRGFQQIIFSSTAASGHTAAWLGEVIVHAEDIRRPLGIDHDPQLDAVTEVARFYARRDFAVPSKRAVRGLRLEASDGPFAAGDGPQVRGPTLALVMAMAGRGAYCAELDGPGVAVLRDRIRSDRQVKGA